MRHFLLFILTIPVHTALLSQNLTDKEKANLVVKKQTVIIGKDTITQYELADCNIEAGFSDQYLKYAWYRAIVAKVYPYTNLIDEMIVMYDSAFSAIDEKKEKKKYRNAEYEKLQEEFGYFVSRLTQTEGRVFMQLIHRKTGMTAYEITRKFLGKPKAFMWQGIAWLGGADLKLRFDRESEDGIIIEKIITEIDQGKMIVLKKPVFVPKKPEKKKKSK